MGGDCRGWIRAHSWLGRSRSTRLVMAADHPTTSLNYPNHAAASFRNVHKGHPGGRVRDHPTLSTGDDLVAAGRRIERGVADGAPQQLKRLLDTVVDQILVESRACIQPYFVAPTVRTRPGSRRRTGIEPA